MRFRTPSPLQMLICAALVATALAVTRRAIRRHLRWTAPRQLAEARTAQPLDQALPTREPTPADGFAARHPVVTLLSLVALVLLLLTGGTVFTLTWLGQTFAPLEPVLAFFAWVAGFGPTSLDGN